MSQRVNFFSLLRLRIFIFASAYVSCWNYSRLLFWPKGPSIISSACIVPSDGCYGCLNLLSGWKDGSIKVDKLSLSTCLSSTFPMILGPLSVLSPSISSSTFGRFCGCPELHGSSCFCSSISFFASLNYCGEAKILLFIRFLDCRAGFDFAFNRWIVRPFLSTNKW